MGRRTCSSQFHDSLANFIDAGRDVDDNRLHLIELGLDTVDERLLVLHWGSCVVRGTWLHFAWVMGLCVSW